MNHPATSLAATNPPAFTAGPYFVDDGMIRIADQIEMLRDDIGTDREWVAIGPADEESPAQPASVVALCHPMNAPLFAAAPRLLAALLGAQSALRKALPFLPADTESHYAGEWLDEFAAAIAAAAPLSPLELQAPSPVNIPGNPNQNT